MTGSRLRPRVLVGLFLALLAVALQGVQGEKELDVSQIPSEVECRPYIEKALKDLGTGSLEESSAEIGEGGAEDDDDHVPVLNEQNDEPTKTDNDNDNDNDDDNDNDNDNDNDDDDEAGKDKADQSTKETSTEDNDGGEDTGEDGGDADGQDSVEGGEEDELIAANEPAEDGTDGASSEDTDGDDDNVETIEATSDEAEVVNQSDGVDDTDDDDDQKKDDNSTDETDDDGVGNETGEEQDDGVPAVGSNEENGDNDAADGSTEEIADDNNAEVGDGVANKSKDGDSDEDKNDTDSGEDNTGDNDSSEDRNEDNQTDEDSKEENHSNSAADDGDDAGTEDTREDNSEEERDGPSLESVEKQDDDNDDDDGSKQDDVDGDNDDDYVKKDENDSEDSKEKTKDSKEDSSEGGDGTKESTEDGDDGAASASTESPDDDTKSEENEEVNSRDRREVGDEAEEQKENEEDKTSNEGKDDETEKADSGEEVDEKEESEGSDEDEEAEPTPEEDLIQEIEVPENLRPREHINQLLKLDEENEMKEQAIQKAADIVLRDLKRLYDSAIKPLETLYKYRDLSNRHFGDPEIFSKPLVLFMGPWSGGKSSIVNYLLDNEYKTTSLRTGAEPSPAYFNILMYGEEEEILDGTQLAADWTFSGLQKFGQGMLDRLRGVRLKNKLLEKVNIVEIPGILEIRKQVQRLFPFNDACQWFIDRADIIFLVYDPAKLDVGPETEAILDQLKGREYQTRIILNKADQVKPEELMRVQGALIWNISPLMSSSEPPVMYSTSLWSLPYEAGAPTRLLYAQERAFLRDLRSAIDKRVEHKIASARRFAVRVRNHAKMVDCYLTTYYNQKSFFGNKKDVSDKIIENPQDYHIYEGLSTLTNISRYDLPDPDVYKDFFRLNALYDFQQLSSTCTYFRGCPINRLDIAIAYDLPELVGKYKKSVEAALHEGETSPPPS